MKGIDITTLKHSEVLKSVDQLFDSEKKWIHSYLAVDAAGNTTSPTSDKAECFCFLGGVARVLHEKGENIEDYINQSAYDDTLLAHMMEANGGLISEWYDVTEKFGGEYAHCAATRMERMEVLMEPDFMSTAPIIYAMNDSTPSFAEFKKDIACAIADAEKAEAEADEVPS